MPVKVVIITAPPGGKSREIAQTLVHEKLAACVNVIPGIHSVYTWKGQTEEQGEDLLIVKSSGPKLAALERRLCELHPYDTPEFVVITPEHIAPAYLKWLKSVLED